MPKIWTHPISNPNPILMEPDKICCTCGRTITWRKKWEKCWEEVRYCSDACRKNKPGLSGAAVEAAILELLGQRQAGATICPSEVARQMWPEAWQERMEETRQAARRLVAAHQLEITQAGKAVDPSTAKGPIRLRLPR